VVLSFSFLTVCGVSCVPICSYVAAFVANKDVLYKCPQLHRRSQEFILRGALLRPEGPKFEAECREWGGVLGVRGVQGHPRSLIWVRIESAYATSYLSVIVTLSYLAPFQRYCRFLCS